MTFRQKISPPEGQARAARGSPVVIYDWRFPLWFRIPALGFGVGILWFGVSLAAWRLFGVGLGFSFSKVSGSPTLGSLACVVIAAAWIFIWLARIRILFDTTRQELIVCRQGYVRSQERRTSLAGGREFHIRRVRSGLSGRKWEVSIEFIDRRTERLADILSGADALAESLTAATQLPVNRS